MLIRTSALWVVGVAFALSACDRSKSEGGGAEGRPVTNTNAIVKVTPPGSTSTATAPSAGAGVSIANASNAASVTRFADESAMTPMRSRLVPSTTVRATPLGRMAVASVEQGSEATLLAKKGDYYLVMFADPHDSSRALAGWVYKDGVAMAAATASNSSSTLRCKDGEVGVLADGLCARACARDADCASVGGVCDGNGPVAVASGVSGRAQYCVTAPQP